jgi:succinylarginine dihydrolase
LSTLFDRLGPTFKPLVVRNAQLSVADAVSTYLFNSQLLETPSSGLTLICPSHVHGNTNAKHVVDGWLNSGSIDTVHYMDLHESMHNGGGPACLRLRVPLNEAQISELHPGLRIDEARLDQLANWIEQWYPDTLKPADLGLIDGLETSRNALSALCGMLSLPDLYPFQR